eukprot:11177384-Lingulodinium_polyedra.AAC.1
MHSQRPEGPICAKKGRQGEHQGPRPFIHRARGVGPGPGSDGQQRRSFPPACPIHGPVSRSGQP